MELMTPQVLGELAAERGAPRVSLYLPIDRSHARALPNKTRFRNLLRSAEEALVASGLAPDAAVEALIPARQLLDSGSSGRRPARGSPSSAPAAGRAPSACSSRRASWRSPASASTSVRSCRCSGWSAASTSWR